MCSVAAVAVVGLGTKLIGNVMAANARNKAADANAAYYRSLADTSEEQAEKVLDAAEIQQKYLVTSAAKESKRKRNEFKRIIGAQKVVFASNGIGAGSTTAMDVALDTLTQSAEDEDLIRYNADVSAAEIWRGSEFQADQLNSQAKHYRTAARNELSTKNTNILSSILTGATDVASTFVQLNSVSGRA